MLRNKRILCILLTLLVLGFSVSANAQTLRRYVKTSGSPGNSGLSWDNAMDNLQEAINSLHQEMLANGITQGVIYVAAGKYNPTESTEAQNSNILNTSFLIYDGITIYGGYPANPHDGDSHDPDEREMKAAIYNGKLEDKGKDGDRGEVGPVPVNKWEFKYETVLSGNHTTGLETTFTYNKDRAQYNTHFPSSSFHVVWFATKGAIDSESVPGHYQGLATKAGIDGCIIEEGYASSRDLNGHNHMGFGGGAYMVKNSFLRNCIIRRCQAAQRGGGVYMDGGGEVDNCFIYECQTTGVAIAQGYGGGVCIDYNGSVVHSHLAQNTARIGGGLAICHSPGEYPAQSLPASERANSFSPFASACVIANNSTNAEAGGVYLDEGGTINHCTVVKNNCIGPDITYYGRRHGRSGGIYVRNCGSIYNSVFWGNQCQANNDMQFASVRQSSAASTDQIDVYYSAFYNQDITDWSNVTKQEVYTLTAYNRPHRAESDNCCWYELNYELLSKHGTVDWWDADNSGSLNKDLMAGVDYNTTTLVPNEPQILTTWRPRHSSFLAMKGVQISSTFHINSEWIRHAHVDTDILGKPYETVSTLGAVAHREETFKHSLVAQQGEEGRLDPTTKLPTIFVYGQRSNIEVSRADKYNDLGESWDYPIAFLADAVNYLDQYRIKEKSDAHFNEYYIDGTYYPAVQILIKEGTVTTAGKGNYEANDIRTAAIRPKSNMRFYGGYPNMLEGTVTDGRNPDKYVTLLSSSVDGQYDNNSAHAFGIINAQNVIIDGVRMAYGNVVGMETSAIVKKGTGIIISNTTIPAEERIDMTGIQLRNSVIANTQAYDGSAIYVNSIMPKEDNSIVRSELTVKNTVIRNCTSIQDENQGSGDGAGIIVANGNTLIDLDHCTIVNNVGHPLKTQTGAGRTGEIVITNSVLFANSRDRVDGDRTNITTFSATLPAEPGTITGHHNMFDSGAPKDGTLQAESTNRYILDISSSSANYPTFKNPSSNVGHSEGVDRPLYGGTVSYEPLNRNPIVNAADEASMTRRDRTDIDFFDYGGASDLGAIENTNLPKNGAALYVTQNGAGRMDGSSWDNAIAGNLVYKVGESYVVDEVNADKDGKYITTRNNLYRGGYALDYVYKTGLTTYIDRQTVTQKRFNLTYDSEGNLVTTEEGESTPLDETEDTQVITEDNTLTRQKTEFIYGEKSGASRNFYRTNLKDTQITSAYQANNANGYYEIDIDNALAITNNRAEDYVSGLQFAVEKAAELNKGKAIEDRVQVWVGNGTYEDYKGFVMRDKVEVFGGFPTTKYAAPGLNERHALVSEYIPLSKVNASLEGEKNQYETILQVIDKKPFDADTWGFNKDDVILYTDKDYTENGNKTITTTATVTIPVYYRRDALPAGGYSDYYEVKGGNVQSDCSDKLVNPSFEQNAGTGNWSDTKAKNGWTITQGTFTLTAGGGSYTSLHGGAIIDNKDGFEFYQDVNGLEPGLYRVSCQGFNKGGAAEEVALFANGNQRVLQTVSSSDASSATNAKTGFNLLAAGKYDNNWVDVFVGDAGHLRIGLKGTYTANNAMTIFDKFRLERLSGSENIAATTTTSKEEGYANKTFKKEYSTFRKPVLYMPDVCMTTQWPATINGKVDTPSNTARWELSGGVYRGKSGTGMEVYTDAHWDGFTIRNGFIYDYFANRDGGAGVRMFEGGTLENCVVVDNANMGAIRQRGGGGYCDGRTSKVVGCFFVHNLNSGIRNTIPTSSNDKDTNGGGIYLIVGTCYNSLFANNVCWGNDSRGAGIYIEQATFYNNTVAYNACRLRNKDVNTAKGNGVHQYEGSNGSAKLNVFNTIFYGNTGPAIGAQNVNLITGFKNCYIKSANAINGTIVGKMEDCILDNAGKDKNGNSYTAPNPFEKGDDAPNENNYRLKTGSYCINKGMIPEGQEETFPKKDVDFADRIQDCVIDIGAYEYNGAVDIAPDVTTFADQMLAVYYVTENGFETGDASANTPGNAACYMKLQKVLDAAGRWKYKHAVTDPDEYADFTPVVALAGNVKDDAGNLTTFKYMPERSTKHDQNVEDNVIDYSLIVPHGVQLWGGFYAGTTSKPGFYETDSDGKPVKDSEGHTKMLRDPLRYPTYITGDVTSSTGAEGRAHHVIQFTNDLFDENEDKIPAPVSEGGIKTYGQLAALTDEKDRAVLDGLFIVNGYANGSPAGDGSVTDDMNGAAAIVTSFAHVRNCVITNNRAMGHGGGLYLEPHALVSGCIVKNNEAQVGGGVYVAQPEADPLTGRVTVDDNTYAFLLTSTIVYNTATKQGGGMVFDNNLRANSCIFWHNSAVDKNNVSGQQIQSSGESSSVSTTNYPMVYCGIEVVRWEGVNNLLVSANETEGVRWDHNNEYYEKYHGAASSESLYYPIEMSSVLSRAGMTYNNWNEYRAKFPTLELTDISGMKRMENETAETVTYSDGSYVRKRKDNSLIEMGARVVNATFEVKVDEKHIMKRLYVVHTEDLNSEVARKLQDNAYADDDGSEYQNRAIMYSQMGSCFANPFHRLGDALEYVMNVRKSTQMVDTDADETPDTEIRDIYKNQRFEIFLTNGTFYPYRNAYGMQAASRSNTFVIPEMVSIIGGVDCTKPYGQEGYGETGADDSSLPIKVKGQDDVPLTLTYTRTIRKDRLQSDLNMNNVVEPWELNNQSILSGNVISGTETKNAYHVITCYPDDDKVGQLPTLYSDASCSTPTTERTAESRESRTRRTIIIDGITVTAGLANDISDEDKTVKYQQQTYFRGGGILVDGNWDKVDELGDYTPDVIGVANRNIPLLVTGCMFQDNMAANGGAIYTNGSLNVFGCHFAQNTSRGPNTEEDQRWIPWSAGGAIATNYDCMLVNSIFANNEAKRGSKPITKNNVEHADIRQGFGGVISASETSTVHAMNCDFVRNKAVAFPAVYNFLCQSEKSEKVGGEYKWECGDRHHWVVNSIFWGNEKNEDTSSGGQTDTYTGYDGSRLGSLFEVAAGKTPRKREDVANFGINDRSEELLFFCAYEQEFGLPSELLVIADDDHKDDHKKFDITSWDDFERGSWIDNWPATWQQGDIRYTHNQYLASENNAISGPNFIQPSTKAGADGYMQNADWLVSRLNRIIDNGWSYLPQHVTSTKVEVDETGEIVDAFNTIFAHDPGDRFDEDGRYVSTDKEQLDNNETLTGTGIYNFYSIQVDRLFSGIGMGDLVALGEHPYMKYDQYGETSGMSSTMRRISTYPKQGEQEVFIDIGVYEYQYVQLFIPGNAYDVIWVRPDNPTDGTVADGTTWERATNNVQQAIDMLMSSHNDHDKVLKMRAGDYSPVYLTHGKLSFYIEHDDNPSSVLYPTATGVTDYLGVNSITIRGGYPNDLTVIPNKPANGDFDNPSDYEFDGESVRNPELYPTRFVMSGATGYENKADVKDNLFIIQNMEMQEANRNFITATELDKQGYAVPVAFEGLTFSNPYSVRQGEEDENKQGAAILYGQQHKFNNQSEYLEPPKKKTKNSSNEWEYSTDGRPKLLIKDCIFLDNSTKNADGTPATLTDGHRSPAVNIMGGGGNAVVANSLFHSNGGIPLQGYNTKVINCSFALNNGQLTLKNNSEVGNNDVTGSSMHNSIIWRDLLTSEDKPYNFESAAMLGKNNAIWHAGLTNTADANGNQTLADSNTDILNGPNFTNPSPDDPWQRDMHPRPSDRIMSKGDISAYKAHVPFYNDESTIVERSMKVGGITRTAIVQTVTRNIQPKTGETGAPTEDDWKQKETELAHMPRFLGKGLERGPYETVAAIQRVLYVDPVKGVDSNNDGATWERAFSGGQLQNAIDAAGVYSATNGGQRAFVFVKGAESAIEPSVLARNGVTVYGSVANSLDEPPYKEVVDGDYTFKEKEIFNYINRVRAERSGIASTTITSKLRGLLANGEDMTSGFVLDGFGITNGTDHLTTTPVVLNDDKTLLRNCLIYSNHVEDGKPVVNINQGLLYNSLLYGNNASTVVNILEGATGGVLNCTVVAEGEGQTAVVAAQAGKVVNTVTYNNASKTVSGTETFVNGNSKPGMFAPYLHSGANAYNYPFGTQEPLWYQLHEDSECINGGTNDWSTYFSNYSTLWEGLKGNADDGWIGSNGSSDDPTAQRYIDFAQDRDILGNPRLLFATVDRGAFETWRIADNAANATEITNETETADSDLDGRVDCPVKNYGGHTYPHVGSVVYIGENASMLVKSGNFTSELHAMVPGYLLLKKGASFYGQGNYIRVPYVATEHAFAANQQYALFSLPYDWDKANVVSLTADADADALTQTNRSGVIAYQQSYNGSQRAQWGSGFHVTDSPFWETVAQGTANEGYLLTMNTPGNLTLRFTAWGINDSGASVDVYTENNADKVIELTQYNSNELAAGTGTPRFTNMEDMGWNLKGQPWLVSSFKTYATDGSGNYDASSQDYGMNVPHLLYKNVNIQTGVNDRAGVATDLLKHGQFISGRSWTDGSTLELGSAFFTQTAVMDDMEELTFKRPVYSGTKDNQFLARVSIARKVSTPNHEDELRGECYDDVVEICPKQDAESEISYHPSSDGLKWYALNESLAHIFVPSTTGTKLSIVAKAPVDVEIPLGITLPEAGEYTIALPQPEAYDDFEAVWIIDHQTGSVSNLLEHSYVLSATGAGEVTGRLTLKFGRLRTHDALKTPSTLKLAARHGRLPLVGLSSDASIRVYNAKGLLVFSGIVDHLDEQPLSDGVYIVRVVP